MALRGAVLAAALAMLPAGEIRTSSGLPPIPERKPPLPESVTHLVSRSLTSQEQAIKAAIQAARRGRFTEARQLAAQSGNPLASALVDWYHLTRDGVKAPFRKVTAFLEQRADWPRQERLLRTAEYSMPLDLPNDEVLAWFEARPATTPEGSMAHARALMRAGRKAEAAELVRHNWIHLNFNRSQELQYHRRYRRLIRQADEQARLDRLLWDHQRYAATRQAKRLGAEFSALVRARMKLRFSRPGLDKALRSLPARFRDDHGIVFERANWRMRRARFDGVVELIDPPSPEAPFADKWWPMRQWAARRALERDQVERAYRLASGHGLTEGQDFAAAEWLAGWIALRHQNHPEIAYAHFSGIYDRVSSPLEKSRSAFWAGEAAVALNKGELAERWYSNAALYGTTFYGQRAAERLGRPPLHPATGFIYADPMERKTFDQRESVRLVRLLGVLGEESLQRAFLIRLRDTAQSAEDFLLTAELAEEAGRPDLTLKIALEAHEKGVFLPRQLFPVPLFVLPVGGQPEPALVLALIRQESNFIHAARSGAGARGLMQVLPVTAHSVARKIDVPYSKARLTEDPEYNITIGRAYLEHLLSRYDGSYVLALAAYNAGPSRVDDWIRRNGDPRSGEVSPVDWIESIGIDETRVYVQRVLEAMTPYRYYYPDAATSVAYRPL